MMDLGTGTLTSSIVNPEARVPGRFATQGVSAVTALAVFSATGAAREARPLSTPGHARALAVANKGGHLNTSLLRRAREIVAGLAKEADPFDIQTSLTSLLGVVTELWNSIDGATERHIDILSVLEDGVRVGNFEGSVTADQVEAFRAALTHMHQHVISPALVQMVREQFVDAGFTALSFIDE